MNSSRAFKEVREVVGPSVSDSVIAKALKDHMFSAAGAINQIVDLTLSNSTAAYREEQANKREVVVLIDDEDENDFIQAVDAPKPLRIVDSSSKRFRESPPTVLVSNATREFVSKSAAAVSVSEGTSIKPRAYQRTQTADETGVVTTKWPKVLGRRSVDAESTYRGRPPPEMIPGSPIIVERFASFSQKNRIIRLATSKGTEIGRLPSALSDILAPLLDAGCIVCKAHLEFLPERLEIFTRFCITIEFNVTSPEAFNCFDIAQSGHDGDDDTVKKKRPGFSSQDDEDLADRFWRTIQLSFGALNVDGVYQKRLFKGTVSLLGDDTVSPIESSSTLTSNSLKVEKELSEEELFGSGKDLKLSSTTENDDSDVKSGLTVQLRVHQRIAVNWMKKRESGDTLSKTSSSISHHPLWTETKFEDGTSFYLNRFTRMATVVPPPNVSHLCKGGILADEMGLGKTVVVLGRITQDLNEMMVNDSSSHEDKVESEAHTDDETEYGTLVIVVTSLLSQWEDEIDSKITVDQPGRLSKRFSRFTYYGSDREADTRLKTADIVLTTFGVVASEHKSGNVTLFGMKWRRIVLE